MANRLDIELTSRRDDGTWTWRAAGARQPKGVLRADLLPDAAKVGDVVRAEAEITVDGIVVTSISAGGGRDRRDESANRIEVVGTRRDEPGVTTALAPRSRREPGRGRGPRRGADDRGRPEGERRGRGDRRGEQRPARSGEPRGERDRGERDRGERRRGTPRPKPAPLPSRPKPKRLRPGNAHRGALLASLSDEQRPVAEQLLRGGIPAVRAAIREQNEAARKAGSPEVPAEPLLKMAEELHARARTADWLDRAEAAVTHLTDLSLTDLRSVVTAADDVARDDTTRALAEALRDGLRQRLERAQQEWVEDVTAALETGRVVRALRVSGRPPDPKHRLPDEILGPLAEAAGVALAADVAPDRWAIVLDAVSFSPVRRQVQPSGVPPEPPAELLAAVGKAAQRCPGIAKAFGIDLTAPPGTARRKPVPPPPPPLAPAAAAEPPATVTVAQPETVAEPEAAAEAPDEPVAAAEPPTTETLSEPAADAGGSDEPAAAEAGGSEPEPAAEASEEPAAAETGGSEPEAAAAEAVAPSGDEISDPGD